MYDPADEFVKGTALVVAFVGFVVLAYMFGVVHGEKQGRAAEQIACEAKH